MKIIEEAKRRRVELMQEMSIIDQLLGIYGEPVIQKINGHIPSDMTLKVAYDKGYIDGRSIKVIAHLMNRPIKELQFGDAKVYAAVVPDSEFLKIPDCGRRSLKRIRDVMERVR